MNDFSELKYQLPSKESAHYIKIAVDIIRDLQKATPSALVYLLEASNILLFAGMRSASPYNDFADLSSDDISNLKGLLRLHGIHTCNEATEEGSYSYLLTNLSALKNISCKYSFIAESFPVYSGDNIKDLMLWTFLCERHLANRMYDLSDSLPIEWSRDYYSPSTLLLGMQLGYPGKAISSLLHSTTSSDKNNSTDMIEVTIDKQDGTAHVTFDVHRSIRQDAEIIETEKLWKTVITGVKKEFDKT